MFPLNFLIASSEYIAQETPSYEIYGITEEMTNVEAKEMWANYNLKFTVSGPTSAIACTSIGIVHLIAAFSPVSIDTDSVVEIFELKYAT